MSEYETEHAERSRGAGAEATGVTLYRPIIVASLYILNLMLGFTVLVGLILAYVWRNDEDVTEWEETHHTYLIRTFWIGFWVIVLMAVAIVGTAIALSAGLQLDRHMGLHGTREPVVIALVFGSILVSFLLFVWYIVRSILSLANAANRRPMPKPKTWFF